MGLFETKDGNQALAAYSYILAYGSNLNLERMKSRCPGCVLIGTTEIPGYRLLFKQSKTGAYATIEQDANCTVPAAVYKVSWQDEARLDRYEGCPRYYYKREFLLRVRRLNGKQMRARQVCVAYVMREHRLLGQPSKAYFQLLDDGYTDFDFDVAILDKALGDSIGDKRVNDYLEDYLKRRDRV